MDPQTPSWQPPVVEPPQQPAEPVQPQTFSPVSQPLGTPSPDVSQPALPVEPMQQPTNSFEQPLQQLSQAIPIADPQQAVPPAQPEPVAPEQPAPSLYEQTEPQLTTPTQTDQPVPAFENIYTEICSQIIKEQGRIIGMNLALEQAQNVQGLSVDPVSLHCTVEGDGSKVINDLIEKYSDFFGHAAVEVCREAASRFLVNLSAEQTPTLLQ